MPAKEETPRPDYPRTPVSEDLLDTLSFLHQETTWKQKAYQALAGTNPLAERLVSGKSRVEQEAKKLGKLAKKAPEQAEGEFACLQDFAAISTPLPYQTLEDLLGARQEIRKTARRSNIFCAAALGGAFGLLVVTGAAGLVLSPLIGEWGLNSLLATGGGGAIGLEIYCLVKADREEKRGKHFPLQEWALRAQQDLLRHVLLYDRAYLRRNSDEAKGLFDKSFSEQERIYALLRFQSEEKPHPWMNNLENEFPMQVEQARVILEQYGFSALETRAPLRHYLEHQESFLPWYRTLSEEEKNETIRKLVASFEGFAKLGQILQEEDKERFRRLEREHLDQKALPPETG